MKYNTRHLRMTLAPDELEPTLKSLKQQGAIIRFTIYEKSTIIIWNVGLEVSQLFQEADAPRPRIKKREKE